MSSTFSLLLLLLLLLSLHACDARSLRNHTSKQENEKLDPARVSNEGARESNGSVSERVVGLKGGGGGEPEAAGFNQLDYLPPKTHPPVHN